MRKVTMRKMTTFLTVFLLASVLLTFAAAHETQTVGEGEDEIRVIVGMVKEPVFTEERTGLDLIIQNAQDEPIENLESSLEVTFRAPDGVSTRTLELRPQYGKPGYYTDDILLSEAGEYEIQVVGFIGEREIDLTFHTHGVSELETLRFP